MIELAAKLGYIRREKKKLRDPDRVGRPAIVNLITPEGRQLLQDLGLINSRSGNHKNHSHKHDDHVDTPAGRGDR